MGSSRTTGRPPAITRRTNAAADERAHPERRAHRAREVELARAPFSLGDIALPDEKQRNADRQVDEKPSVDSPMRPAYLVPGDAENVLAESARDKLVDCAWTYEISS
jgi:hypothetical protein